MKCKQDKHPHINTEGQYEFWRDPYYKKYIYKYGYHFNPATLARALGELHNRDGSRAKWTREEVHSVISKSTPNLPNGMTVCDVAYIANMLYSKYFGSSVVDDATILKMTHDFISAPGRYTEDVFADWLNDIMFTGCPVDWKAML